MLQCIVFDFATLACLYEELADYFLKNFGTMSLHWQLLDQLLESSLD